MKKEVQEFLDKVKPLIESATASELFTNCNELAESPELRKETEEAIQAMLPEGFVCKIDNWGICRIGTPLYVSSQVKKIKDTGVE